MRAPSPSSYKIADQRIVCPAEITQLELPLTWHRQQKTLSKQTQDTLFQYLCDWLKKANDLFHTVCDHGDRRGGLLRS